MKKLVFILLTTVSLNCFSQVGAKNFIDQNFIEVTGKAEMEIVPDKISLKIIINEKDFKGKEKLEDIEKSMFKKLTKIGIDISKNLTIKDMVSNFKNYWLKNKTIHSVKEYQLTVKDAKAAGLVFQSLESIGISNISINKIDHSEIQKFRTDVKIKAIQAAKNKASLMASAIDQQIGNAIYIQELNTGMYNPLSRRTAGLSNIVVRGYAEQAEAYIELEIEFEKINIEYSILVRFELK